MILPIIGYGHSTLRKKAVAISPDYPNLQTIIANMFDTMYKAQGVGLAAPQVNLSIRLFIVDAEAMEDVIEGSNEVLKGFKKVFINAEILEETGKEWAFREGCLSIPEIREDVFRKDTIRIKYFDEHFVEHEEVFSGMKARIIQHEYDHIEGILFVDKISAFRKQIVKSRLMKIQRGEIHTEYPMKFIAAR